MKRKNKKALHDVTLPVLVSSTTKEAQGVAFNPTERVRRVNREELMDALKGPHADEFWRIPWMNTLKTATERRDKLALAKASEKLTGRRTDSKAEPFWELWDIAVADLSAMRLVYWLEDKAQRISAGIYCPDLKTAIAASWLLSGTLRACPHCQKIF